MARKTEPESARDMWWAQRQYSGIITVGYENPGNGPKEGVLSHREFSVVASECVDCVMVKKESWYYDHKEEGVSYGGWPLKRVIEWSKNMSFEEFRSSKLWKPYLERTKKLDFDSSWMDSFNASINEENKRVDVSFRIPYESGGRQCPTGRTVEYRMYVYDDGTVGITRDDDRTVERSVDEIIDAIRIADRMRKRGVSVEEDGTITIKAVEDAD